MSGLLSHTTDDVYNPFPDLFADSDSDNLNSPSENFGFSRICSKLNLPPAVTASSEQPVIVDGRGDYILNVDDPDDIDHRPRQPEDKCDLGTSATQTRISEADTIPHVLVDSPTTKPISHSSAQRIEAMVVDFLEQLCKAIPTPEGEDEDVLRKKTKNPRKIELRLADRKKPCNDDDRGAFDTRAQFFPGRTSESILPFAQIFRVSSLAHEAILDGLPSTKRDLFYKDIPLFKKQSVVDKIVDDLAATIDTERAHLNIRASKKGLICGVGLSIQTVGGDVICITESDSTLIPVAEDILSLHCSNNVMWVLIVEKEAIFQTLCQLCFMRHPAWNLGSGIMITGKGYPDLATRQLVKNLSDKLPPTVPIVALVDGDAYGLDIVSVYKFGSMAFRHEASKLAAGRVECIGVWASELASLGIDKDALIPISRADEKKARSLLHRELPERWKKELMHMLYTRRKAETEILSSVPRSAGEPHALIRYLGDKIWGCICSAVIGPNK